MGEGAYGTVTKAYNTENNEIVAIKKIKENFFSWDEALNMREIKSLRKITHPNVI